MKRIIASCSFIVFSAQLAADPYSFEGVVSAVDAEQSLPTPAEDRRYTKSDTYIVEGRYYLSPVETGSAPLAEANFLARSSFVSASYFETDGEEVRWLPGSAGAELSEDDNGHGAPPGSGSE